jgi:hypothetical protein
MPAASNEIAALGLDGCCRFTSFSVDIINPSDTYL